MSSTPGSSAQDKLYLIFNKIIEKLNASRFSYYDSKATIDLISCNILLGTPGRVFDMISRKVLRTYDIKMFVLDEADEMLSRGFKDQIYDVFRHLNSNIQVNILL